MSDKFGSANTEKRNKKKNILPTNSYKWLERRNKTECKGEKEKKLYY